MAVARPVLGFCAIVLLAGGILLQFFVILSGTTYSVPENQIYFLEASTSGVGQGNGVPVNNPTRWTYFSICGADAFGNNLNCGAVGAAIPFNPPQNFNTNDGLAESLVNNQNRFFLLSRFAWVFYLIALFFAVITLLASLVALFSRLGAYLVASTTSLAVFFQALAAALMTAWTVQGRDAFNSNGQEAYLGTRAYGFTYGAFACWFIAMVLFCIGGTVGRESGPRRSMFGRKRSTRSTRSRGSFIDTDRRIKDEYD